MRKLIEIIQENLIVCDYCFFKIPNENKNKIPIMETKKYLNVPCPKCGNNLLTEKDYIAYAKLMSGMNWINKWFSWITIFKPKGKTKNGSIKVHDGVKIK